MLIEQIDKDIKGAMLAKDADKLRALRGLKAAITLKKTEKPNTVLSEEDVLSVIQKAIKSRRESADIYKGQNREDLLKVEMDEIAVLEAYLPQQLSQTEISNAILSIINETGATTIKEMGKVMGIATKQLAGKADNAKISAIVRNMLGG